MSCVLPESTKMTPLSSTSSRKVVWNLTHLKRILCRTNYYGIYQSNTCTKKVFLWTIR